VIAIDNGMPPRNSTAAIHVHVTDFNDNAPKFTKNSYDAHVLENATDGDVICVVNATDADAGVNAEIVYNITSGNNGALKINKFTVS